MTISQKQEGNVMNLPPKPESVSHVTDAHWEAALRQAWLIFSSKRPSTIDFEVVYWGVAEIAPTIIDHARCLILLGEVKEPVDPLGVAFARLLDEYWSDGILSRDLESIIRKHLAGMTIPEAGQ
jgi:hypothetical protein